MNILVTGANGYLGCGVVRQLLDDGHAVTATDLDDTYIDDRAAVVKTDLFAQDAPYTYFGEPDVLLHMAWRDGFRHGSLNHINDLPRHYDFIRRMLEGGLRQVCVMGSMHEVGFFEGSIDENTPTNPQSLYGISKDALRNSVKVLARRKGLFSNGFGGFTLWAILPTDVLSFQRLYRRRRTDSGSSRLRKV